MGHYSPWSHVIPLTTALASAGSALCHGTPIIWCSYGRDLLKVMAALTREFGEGSTVAFWGQNRKDREESSSRFKTDPDCRFIVATPGSGGRGRDWSEANLIAYYSNTDNLNTDRYR